MARYFVIFIVFGFQFTPTLKASDFCVWQTLPQIVHQTEGAIYEIWQEEDRETFWETLDNEFAPLSSYRNWVTSHVDPEPYALLIRQKELYVKAGLNEYIYNFDLLINKTVGKIRDLTCLEGLLLGEHTARYPLEILPTEFSAYILSKKENNSSYLKIHFYSNKEISVSSDLIIPNVVRDLNNGWTMEAHLHNHPFWFDNPSGDIAGTTIPSGTKTSADIKHYLEMIGKYHLQNILITNGFSTLDLPYDEIDKFH